MKFVLCFFVFVLLACSDKAIVPKHVKMAEDACKDRSTWKSIEKNGDQLWVVCADDVPMNLSLSGEHH